MPVNYVQKQPGLRSVGQYQCSGIPYATGTLAVEASSGTPFEVSFQNVTRFFTVKNAVSTTAAAAPLRLGFSSLGVQGSNYVTLANGESYSGELAVSRLYLLGDTASATSASVIAGLTGIGVGALQSNWSGTMGVG